MPTFNQLVKIGRKTSKKKSTAPALNKSLNSLKKKVWTLTVQWVMKTNADTVTQMQTMVKQAGKNQEQFILNCSETLSESTKALDSTIEKMQQKIMKIIIATTVSAVALSVLVCVVFWKLAV